LAKHEKDKEGLWKSLDELVLVIMLVVFGLFCVLLTFTGYNGLITGVDAESSSGSLTNAATIIFIIPFWLILSFNFKVATWKQKLICILTIMFFLGLLVYTVVDFINFIS
jgi:hypothetical protein